MKKYGVIYVVTNSVNGKQYVGQTTSSVSRRWRCVETSKSLLGNAVRKYGRKSFVFKEVAEAESKKMLDCLEQKWIFELKTIAPDGYNLTSGGYSVGMFSEITKSKMSATRLNKLATDIDFRAAVVARAILIGKDKDASEKRSKSFKKFWSNPENKKNMSASIRAGHNTPQAKTNFSKAHKATWADPDYKAHMSATHKAISSEKRERMRLASKAARQNPEVRAERSRLAKAMWADPSFRAKIADTKALSRAARQA